MIYPFLFIKKHLLSAYCVQGTSHCACRHGVVMMSILQICDMYYEEKLQML